MARNQSDGLYGNTDSTRCAVVRARTAAHSEKRSACRVSIGVVWSRRMNFVCSRRMVNSKRRGLTAPQSFHVQRPVFSASLCPPVSLAVPCLSLPPLSLGFSVSSRFSPPSSFPSRRPCLSPSAPPLSLSLSLLSPLDRMVMQRTAAAAAAAAAASRACVNPAYEGVAPRRRVNMHARRARATRVRLHAYAYGTDASPHRLAGEGGRAQPCSRVLLPVGYTPMQPIPLPRRSLLEIIFFSRGVTRAGETGMVRHRY